MVKRIDEIKELVAQYLGKLWVEKVILFGSYVEGTANEHSDIDLAIISPDGNDDNLIQCLQLLTRTIPRHLDVNLEPLAFSTYQYNTTSPLEFLGEVKR
ncbi:MAG: nucleotidyltransferase domain-containing protein [candidate division KSB1 bacterium]|nr:nucleotidyltransferase domain-containing protein [candidate division KSB1 bacterium]